MLEGFEYEKYENFISNFKIVFPKKDLNTQSIANSTIKENEWYLSSGEQLIGFELLENSETLFETFVINLLSHASIIF